MADGGHAAMLPTSQGPATIREADLAVPTADELEVIRLVNVERVKAGLWPLAVNASLTLAARAHNEDMISHSFFDHTGSDGSDPGARAVAAGFLAYGWGAAYVGENLAVNYFSPAAVMQAWMSSEAHRGNILGAQYREIGVGFTQDSSCSSFCNYWTQMLGSEPRVLPVFLNDASAETSTTAVKVTVTDETVSSWGSLGPVSRMMLANDPSFAGATWRPYAKDVYWQLPAGDGAKTVYARLQDASGQTVESSSSVEVVVPSGDAHRVFLPLVIRP